MICTEEEAAKKWCPHTRYVVYDDELKIVTSANYEPGIGYEDSCCIGQHCMMWVPTDDDRGSCGLSRG